MPTLFEALHSALPAWPLWVLLVLSVCIPCVVALGVVLGVAGISTYVERKVAADIQRRVGPNQCNVGAFVGGYARQVVQNATGPKAGLGAKLMAACLKPAIPLCDFADKIAPPGILIFMADGLKLILKEDIIPDPVDRPLFKIAPMIVLAAAFGALAVLPYSDAWYVADFNIGLLYIVAITSIEVLGILMAGWASNNKWALLGGMRSAAQIVSYELPVGLAIATGMLLCGTMSMQAMTVDQFGFHANGSAWTAGWFWQWNLFNPAMFVLAPVYFIAALAESNRTPFDIPEAESELVAGYHIEYSGMRFAYFFLAEYAMMWVTCAIAVTLFLGGWSTGIAPLEAALMKTAPVINNGTLVGPPAFYWYGTLLHLLAFCVKTYALILLMMWIRWTIPRFRVDQMMVLCWKKLIPLGMFCFLAISVWLVVRIPLAARLGDALGEWTFWLRALFAVVVSAWLIWFFAKPLEQTVVGGRSSVV